MHVALVQSHPLTLFLVGLASFLSSTALAQNPNWPNRAGDRAAMMDPANWPDDPDYGFDIRGDGQTCISDGGRCFSNVSGGLWNMWSFVPPSATEVLGYRSEETELGAGTWTDLAWTMTTGDKNVVIAVLDSGIRWNERDLVNQHVINQNELHSNVDSRCLPQAPEGHTGDAVDVDGDGFLSMRDWFFGHDEAYNTTLSSELDDAGNKNGIADPGDLITLCSDGVDDDQNGYADDISGWDFFQNDNDPSDDTNYGHGTGEARWSAAEGNNGIGRIGFCPGCRVLMIRTGDSFIVDSQDYAQSVIFAVDSGASVVQEALGALNNTTFMRRAMDYAYEKNVLVVASAADENSRHHNMPGTADHNLYVHAIRYAGPTPQKAKSFLAFNNCTNYGGQLMLSVSGNSCSSEAVGVSSGVAGLIYAAGMADDRPMGPLDPPLRAEEVRQLMMMGADDIYIPESSPSHPDYEPLWYPSKEGWDQRFGYGRLNAYTSVKAVWESRIPPEADIYSPDWFRVLYPEQTGSVTLKGRIAADRADSFDYVIEWAPGIEPADAEYQMLAMGAGLTEAIEGDLTSWDISELDIDNPGEIENRRSVTVRLRVVARSEAFGTTQGEARRVFAIHRDDSLLPGFPVALGVRNDRDLHPGASGEGSPKLADFDGDGDLEIVYGDSDGLLHVFQGDGSELTGFPVRLILSRGLAPDDQPSYASAYAQDGVEFEDVGSSLLATPAVGDLDGDGSLEIVVASLEGDVFVVQADGTLRNGWPFALPEVLSGDPLRGGPTEKESIIERGIFASPALADFDDDGSLEIVVSAFDGSIYMIREDGTAQPGFPVLLTAPLLWTDPANAKPGRLMSSPSIGDINGDGLLDIVVGSNEVGNDPNSGAVHAIHGDGELHEGGASLTGWPIFQGSANVFPMVGEGVPGSLPLADVNGDGRTDVALVGNVAVTRIVDGIQEERAAGEDPKVLVDLAPQDHGELSDITDITDRPFLSTFAMSSMGDVNGDGQVDFVTGGAGLKLAASLVGGWRNEPFSHQIGVWSTEPTGVRQQGNSLVGFPRRIEDYLFFHNPAIADVSGDGYPEVISGSGGYMVHAWDGCGTEAEGFPKFTGSWLIASPAIGDVDGDGKQDLIAVTRMGYMFAFRTAADVGGAQPWPEFRHDNYNTGNHESPLSRGVRQVNASAIECDIPTPPPTDADVGPEDGGPAGDAGPIPVSGCDCRASSQKAPKSILFFALLGLIALRRNRPRS